MGMDEVIVPIGILMFMNGLALYMIYDSRNKLPPTEEIHSRLDEMFEALNIVANVLNQIPNLVPQFSIEQNPLVNAFTEWIRAGREGEPEPQPSIVHHELDAPDGEGD